jgi:hypothetical protein
MTKDIGELLAAEPEAAEAHRHAEPPYVRHVRRLRRDPLQVYSLRIPRLEQKVGDGPSGRRTLSVAMMGYGRLAGFAVGRGGCAVAVGVIVVASPASKMSRPRSSSAAPS